MERQRLTDDEINKILQRASEIDGQDASIDRAILERTASELGISPEAVAKAEAELRQGQVEDQDRALFARHKWQEFWEHFASWFAVNAFLTFIDLRKDGHLDWVFYPVLGWGIAIVIHFVAMSRDFGDPEVDKEFHKWRKSRDKRRKARQ